MTKDQILTGGDRRDHKKWISNTIEYFFNSYYHGDRLVFYSILDTDFQRAVPLNIFLYHPNYNNIDLGILKEVEDIQVVKVENRATATLKIQRRGEVFPIKINLKMEFGRWKIVADDVF